MKLILKFLTTLSDAGLLRSRTPLILRWMMLCTTQYFDFGLLWTLGFQVLVAQPRTQPRTRLVLSNNSSRFISMHV